MRRHWPNAGRIIRQSVVSLLGGYIILTLLYLSLRVFVGERWQIVGQVNMFAHILVIPAPLLLIGCVIWRRWRLSALLLLPTMACVIIYGVFFIPRAVNVPTNAIHFTLLTFNTRFDRTSLEPFADIIREADADVVLMQELSFYAAQYLGQTLLDRYPYQVFYPSSIHAGGIGIMSRYPIVASEYWGTTRWQQRAVLDIAGRQMVIYNAHTHHPFREGGDGLTLRRADVQEIINRATQETLPVILAGDFNITDAADEYGWLTTHFTDAYRAVGQGFGFTFPAVGTQIRFFRVPFSVARLDYVFTSPQIQATAAIVWPDAATSDHHPLRVELALLPEQQ